MPPKWICCHRGYGWPGGCHPSSSLPPPVCLLTCVLTRPERESFCRKPRGSSTVSGARGVSRPGSVLPTSSPLWGSWDPPHPSICDIHHQPLLDPGRGPGCKVPARTDLRSDGNDVTSKSVDEGPTHSNLEVTIGVTFRSPQPLGIMTTW